MNNLVSTTRLPIDHLISGALVTGITVGGLGYNKYLKGKTTINHVAKKTLKRSIQGGIATACAISASNKLVCKNYLGAALVAAVGVGAIILTENLITKNKE